MTPDEALERQLELYRAMTGEQRLTIGFEMTTLAREAERDAIRREFPDADEAEVDRQFRLRRMAANKLKNEQELLTASAAIKREASRSSRSQSSER
jgi:hypothetical protein